MSGGNFFAIDYVVVKKEVMKTVLKNAFHSIAPCYVFVVGK